MTDSTQRLLDWITARGGSTTERELAQGPRRYREPGSARATLDALVRAGDGRWLDVPPGPRGGRPTRRFELGDGTGEPHVLASDSRPMSRAPRDSVAEEESADAIPDADLHDDNDISPVTDGHLGLDAGEDPDVAALVSVSPAPRRVRVWWRAQLRAQRPKHA